MSLSCLKTLKTGFLVTGSFHLLSILVKPSHFVVSSLLALNLDVFDCSIFWKSFPLCLSGQIWPMIKRIICHKALWSQGERQATTFIILVYSASVC